MFGSGDFWDKSPWCFLKIFKNAVGQFIPNCPPKHVITSTNSNQKTPHTRFFYEQHFYKQCQAEIGKKSSKC